MPSPKTSRSARSLSIAAALILLTSPLFPSVAAERDQHTATPKADAQTAESHTLSAETATYKISGTLNDGAFSVRLMRAADGTAVVGAKIGLTINGQTGSATEKAQGVYVYRSEVLKPETPDYEVVITIEDGQKNDLLVGTLASKHARAEEHDHEREPHDTHNHDAHAGKAEGSEKHDHSGHDHAETEGEKGDDHGAEKHAHGGDNHDGHDDHGEDSHGDEHAVKLTPAVMKEFGIKTERADRGSIAKLITRPAEVSFNLEHYTHVVPRVGGIASSIRVSQGDRVKKDQVLAEFESRELAGLKAEYLGAIERFDLARREFQRMQPLRKKGIASEKTYLATRSVFVEARITLRSTRQKLSSIGIRGKVLQQIVKEPDANIARYIMRSPMDGVVISRHLVRGELVSTEREAFVIANLSSVWIDISVYASDIPVVRAGQQVVLETETGEKAAGSISFVTPDVSEKTRTAKARVVLEGNSSKFRPGMFIKASIAISQSGVAIRVPKSAIHVQDGKTVVFANEEGAFKPRPVTVGRQNDHYAEITQGLKPGDTFASEGSFLIKAQLSKASFGDGHNH
ncbi:MAG: efflux RND transporter periplasmic adaptor subunit [Alphaproteobacteria bacterium]|jgi:cobalt-zinc-cadmium efflux system membrane fusion protein